MTQAEIGAVMGVSRATVNAYIADARDRGIVSVRIDPRWLSSVNGTQAPKEKFGLRDAVVVPDTQANSKTGTMAQRIGRIGAELLTSHLQVGATTGVAWGRTVLAMAAA
jgi:dihydroxyacetone kinase-like protein